MSYAEVEDVILEQLKNGNYKISKYWSYGWDVVLTIPKTGKNPRIEIHLEPAHWHDDTSEYQTYQMRKQKPFSIAGCWLHDGWFNNQKIDLYNPALRSYVKEIEAAFWEGQTKDRIEDIKKDDVKWAAKFRKSFK